MFDKADHDEKLKRGLIAYYQGLGIPAAEADKLPAIGAAELDSAQPAPLFDGLGGHSYTAADQLLSQLLAADSFAAANDPFGSLQP